MQEIYIATHFESVYGQFSGDPGNPLILGIHGLSKRNGWHTWQPLLDPLGSAGYYPVSIDLPGWGKSPKWGNEQLDLEKAVEVVYTLIESLGKQRACLMGKSWGGGVAIQLALDYPGLISGLILSAPAYRSSDRLKDLVVPTLLVWAEDDPVIPVRFADYFCENIPNSRFVLYRSGGHSAAMANANDFGPVAIEFLQSLEPHY